MYTIALLCADATRLTGSWKLPGKSSIATARARSPCGPWRGGSDHPDGDLQVLPIARRSSRPARDDEFAALAEQVEGEVTARTPRKRVLALFDAYLDYGLAKPHRFELMFTARRKRARRFPDDFRQRRSPTANLIADALAADRRNGRPVHRDVWGTTLTLAALGHGLIVLYAGGRIGLDEVSFRRLFRRQMTKVLDAFRA